MPYFTVQLVFNEKANFLRNLLKYMARNGRKRIVKNGSKKFFFHSFRPEILETYLDLPIILTIFFLAYIFENFIRRLDSHQNCRICRFRNS
jgi:hypothetical protein